MGHKPLSVKQYKRRQKKRRQRSLFIVILVLCVFFFCLGRCFSQPVSLEPSTPKPTLSSITSYEDSTLLTLVNQDHPVPSQWEVNLIQLKNGQCIDKRAYPDLQAMMDDARSAGLSPLICSSYRTHEKQQELYDQQIQKFRSQGYSQSDAQQQASKWVAVPGTSEHELGLSVDIVAMDHQILDETQEQTAEQQWLMKNCWKYGFILRYPTQKSSITGIEYEPWHYRYVGKEAAKKIMEQQICLEEYLNQN